MGDLYYVYYSASTYQTQISAIGLATSPSMEAGTWTDLGSIGVESVDGSDYNAVDGNLLAINGTNYMTWGSFWGDIFQATLNEDATAISGTPTNIAYDATGDHPVEGAYLYQYGDYYYLFFSYGLCCRYDQSMPGEGEEYRIKVCRSSTSTGGFVSFPFPLHLCNLNDARLTV